MTYRVVFTKRFSAEGEGANRPETFVHVVDGVVLNAVKAEMMQPASIHSQEVMDEDDAFLGMSGVETWEYEIADGREGEFLDALQESEVVLEFERIDDVTG